VTQVQQDRTFIGDINTSPQPSVLDDSRAERVGGFHSTVMAKGCTSYLSNDVVGVVSKPRYFAGEKQILTHVGLAFLKLDIITVVL
jgi:hypothetical protein